MDMWIDLSHSIRRLAAGGAFLHLTDSAVGEVEEENLQHLTSNLAGEIDPARVVPFLTCRHPLDYCLRYADRAEARGLEALTVVGGDPGEGPSRCVPHAYLLRQQIRRRIPHLALGGWVNPHRDIRAQADYLADPDFEADYYLTQVVSHHDLKAVEGWLSAASAKGIRLPFAAGVFYYRNGRRATLRRLASFFPVPVDAVEAAFAGGTTPAAHCARTIVELGRIGVDNVYLCNLGAHAGARRFEEVLAEVDRLG